MQDKLQEAHQHYLNGVAAYMEGKIGPTITSLKNALELDPNHTDAAVCLSVLLNDLGKYDDGKKYFEQANRQIQSSGPVALESSVDHKFSIKHVELGDLYFRYRRFDEALHEFNKALSLCAGTPQALEISIKLARTTAKKGHISRAMQALEALKREYPRSTLVRLELSELMIQQGNILDAELELEAVINIDPQNQQAHAAMERAKRRR